jgi:phosphoserine phosphatase
MAAARRAVTLEFAPGDVLLLLSDGVFEYCNAEGECFGDARVEAFIAARAGAPMQDLAAELLREVQAFADGAPQEDDVTIVLLGRHGEERPA